MSSGDNKRHLAALILAAVVGVCAAGCDRGDAPQNSSAPTPAAGTSEKAPGAPGAKAAAPKGDAADSRGDDSEPADTSADASTDAPESTKVAAAPQVPTPDVALPPSVDGEPSKAGFIFYAAKAKPAPLAEFHKKDLEAKGWKLGKNRSAALAGTTLTGVVQEYARGKDQLTVILTEIASGDPASMGMVLDMPLPPNKQVVVAFPFVIIETEAGPDETAAWFKKELVTRGWAAGKEEKTGDNRVVNFTRTGRSLQAQIRPQGAGKPGSSVQLMHVASGG
jgi:hypothetical protein